MLRFKLNPELSPKLILAESKAEPKSSPFIFYEMTDELWQKFKLVFSQTWHLTFALCKKVLKIVCNSSILVCWDLRGVEVSWMSSISVSKFDRSEIQNRLESEFERKAVVVHLQKFRCASIFEVLFFHFMLVELSVRGINQTYCLTHKLSGHWPLSSLHQR